MGQPEITIHDMCEAYLKDWKRRCEITNEIGEETYTNKRDQIRNHIQPYFGPLKADELTQDYVDGYAGWREKKRLEWVEKSEKRQIVRDVQYRKFNRETGEYDILYKKVPYRVWEQRIPSGRSIRSDIGILLEIYRFCIFAKVIPADCWAPIRLGPRVDVRRGHFNETPDPNDPANTFAQLQRLLTQNARRDKARDGTQRGIQHKLSAEQLYFWANLMAYSGLRSNEMLNLQHCQIYVDEDGDLLIRVVPENVRPRSKVTRRIVVCDPEAVRYWKEYLKWRRKTFVPLGFSATPRPDERVWLDRHGKPETKQIQQRFHNLLRQNGIYTDADGNRLTAYSLRHTYCVRKLRQGVPVYTVASNMGTGVERIQRHYGWVTDMESMKAFNKKLLKGVVPDHN